MVLGSTPLSSNILQKADPRVIDELILSWYTDLIAPFERDRGLIPPGDFNELRFEDLEKFPRECLARLYQERKIEGKDGAAARLEINPSTLRFRMRKLKIVHHTKPSLCIP